MRNVILKKNLVLRRCWEKYLRVRKEVFNLYTKDYIKYKKKTDELYLNSYEFYMEKVTELFEGRIIINWMNGAINPEDVRPIPFTEIIEEEK